MNRNPRSTVGTATELLRYIRLLFAQVGVRECSHCGHKILPLISAYNNPNGACPKCHGIGEIYNVNRSATIDEESSVYDGAFKSWGKNEIKVYVPIVLAAGKYYGFEFDPNEKIKNTRYIPSPESNERYWTGLFDNRTSIKSIVRRRMSKDQTCQGGLGGLLLNPESLTGRCIREYITQKE